MRVIEMKKEGQPGKMYLHVKKNGRVDVWMTNGGPNKYYRGEWASMTKAMDAMRAIGYRSVRQYDDGK